MKDLSERYHPYKDNTEGGYFKFRSLKDLTNIIKQSTGLEADRDYVAIYSTMSYRNTLHLITSTPGNEVVHKMIGTYISYISLTKMNEMLNFIGAEKWVP